LESFWQRWFGWLQPVPTPVPDPEPAAMRAPVRRPFAWYQNPFAGGIHRRPEELIRYSFEALDAWANERGQARHAEETPLEFVDRLSNEFPALEEDARRLATLYAWTAYAHNPLPSTAPGHVRQFWKRLETITETPLSA
jgi:hypothetical protein